MRLPDSIPSDMGAFNNFETEMFKMSAKKYHSVLISEYGKVWIRIAFIIFMGFLISGAILDFRFYILSLLWLCIIIPLTFSFLYFFYGLRLINVLNPTTHKIIFRPDRIILKIYLQQKKAKDKNQEEDEEENENVMERQFDFAYESINQTKSGIDGVTFFFGQGKREFLWIPYTAFPSDILNLEHFPESLLKQGRCC